MKRTSLPSLRAHPGRSPRERQSRNVPVGTCKSSAAPASVEIGGNFAATAESEKNHWVSRSASSRLSSASMLESNHTRVLAAKRCGVWLYSALKSDFDRLGYAYVRLPVATTWKSHYRLCGRGT